VQSPGFLPIVSNTQQETTFTDFLSLAGVSSLTEARNLPSAQVINANIYQVAVAPYGTFVYGPVVDGSFVPALPGVLLQRGQFHKNVNVMVGHNANEGLLFTSPYIKTDQDLKNEIRISLPDISNATLDYIVDTLYPASAFKDITARAATIQAEVGFVCNTYYLDIGFKNQTHAYKFAIFPAIHGQDVEYTFYNDGGTSGIDLSTASFGIANVETAITLQDWITSFAIVGTPSSDVAGVPPFPIYGPTAQALQLGNGTTTLITDDAANPRCQWWQKALYY
jgi:carboxylesterase type B